MALSTPIYRLSNFESGTYFAGLDKKRITTIDSHLALFSDIIGDGRIEGWGLSNVTSSNSLKLSLEEGMGLINRVNYISYGKIEVKLKDNSTQYIYIKGRKGIVGGLSGFSNIVEVDYTDSTSPNSISNFESTDLDWDFVKLEWTSSTEHDFNNYLIQRSENNLDWTDLVEIADISTNEYSDTTVVENTIYYYRIKAVDVNGNSSSYSSLSSFVKTLKNLTPPLRPSFTLYSLLNEKIQLLWTVPAVGNIDRYEIRYRKVNEEYQDISVPNIENVDSDKNNIILSNLENNIPYRIEIFAVSNNGIYSEPSELILAPKKNSGPNEIVDVVVENEESSHNDNKIGLRIRWTPNIDSYKLPPYKYTIYIVNSDNEESQPLYYFNKTSVFIDVFKDKNGNSISIEPRKDYYIKILAEDKNGNINSGIYYSIYTSNFKAPRSPFNLTANLNSDGALLITWNNSEDNFINNILSISKQDLSTLVDTDVESDLLYGIRSTYVIEREDLSFNNLYTITLRCIDEFGNESESTSFEYTYASLSDDIPFDVDDLLLTSGDKNIKLFWKPKDKFKNYEVWKGPLNFTDSTDFTKIATLPSSQGSYVDYDVENGVGYSYFITIETKAGNKSLNPTDDEFSRYVMTVGMPYENEEFKSPINFSLDGQNNTILNFSWENIEPSLDGFQIFRSYDNKSDWELIGSTGKFEKSFEEIDGVKKSGTYYYAVKAFRNEIDLEASESSIYPDNSILAAIVDTSFGEISIDYKLSDSTGLSLFTSKLIASALQNHKHSLTDIDDYRIDLRENIVVTDWSTTNNQIYTTTEDIEGASRYVVKINDLISTIFYSVDSEGSKITFTSKLNDEDVVSLVCVDLREIDGQIKNKNLGNVFANKLTGSLDLNRFKKIDHRGRYQEKVLPLQFLMNSEDGYKFNIYQNNFETEKESIGDTETFYDIVLLTGSNYLVASNKGISLVNSDGYSSTEDSFKRLLNSDVPIHKIFYSQNRTAYFALGVNSVFYSDSGYGWIRCQGLENVSFIRDIVEDSNSNIFISSNLGVFVLKNNELGDILVWEKTKDISVETTDCYALMIDSNNSLIISNEVGLFETSDLGNTWYYLGSEMPEVDPIYDFIEDNGYIFALKDNDIWRSSSSAISFEKISNLKSDKNRKIEILNNRIIISSNDGLFISSSSDNIFTSSSVEMQKAAGPSYSSIFVDITLLRKTGNLLFLGSDIRIWKSSGFSDIQLFHEVEQNDKIPSVYENSIRQKVAFYYNNDNVYFDRINTKRISISNQYSAFRCKNKGWAENNYDSTVEVYSNNSLLESFSGLEPPLDSLESLEFNEFDETNSLSEYAELYSSLYTTTVEHLSESNADSDLLEDGETLISINNLAFNYFYKTYSYYLKDLIFVSDIEYKNKDYKILNNEFVASTSLEDIYSEKENVSFIPSNAEESNGITISSVDGIVSFDTEFDKYNDIYVNIKGSSVVDIGVDTHLELEDKLEIYNSGYTSIMSHIQQSNFALMSLGIDRIYGRINNLGCFNKYYYQSNFIIPRDKTWYDKINSTIDYDLEIEFIDDGISPNYVTCVNRYGNYVLVGTDVGLILISTFDMSMTKVDIWDSNWKNSKFVKDIFIENNTIYLITEDRIFKSLNLVYWEEFSTLKGLSGSFKQINKLYNNILITTSVGVFYYNDYNIEWILSNELNDINNIFISRMAFINTNSGDIYYSVDGIKWNSLGSFKYINDICKYRNNILLATNQGLRSDNSTFFSGKFKDSLVNIDSTVSISENVYINCVCSNSDEDMIVAGASDGNYYIYENSVWTKYTDSVLDTIQRCIFVGEDPWLFSYNYVKTPDYSYPIRIATGTA